MVSNKRPRSDGPIAMSLSSSPSPGFSAKRRKFSSRSSAASASSSSSARDLNVNLSKEAASALASRENHMLNYSPYQGRLSGRKRARASSPIISEKAAYCSQAQLDFERNKHAEDIQRAERQFQEMKAGFEARLAASMEANGRLLHERRVGYVSGLRVERMRRAQPDE